MPLDLLKKLGKGSCNFEGKSHLNRKATFELGGLNSFNIRWWGPTQGELVRPIFSWWA